MTLLMAWACSAQAASGRWSPSAYQAQSGAPTVWADGATASDSYDNIRYAAKFAAGQPDVYPRYGDQANQWLPRLKRGEATLELTFPATDCRQVRIFETAQAGAIRKVWDVTSGETLLYETSARPPAFTEAQVLWIDVAPPRRIQKLRILVDATVVTDWPGIDAVGLVGGGAAPPVAAGQKSFGRWSAGAFRPDANTVWARAATKASSTYDNFRFGTDSMVGPPEVFPRLAAEAKTWAPKNRRSADDWIEVQFAPTTARQIRIFETYNPGAVSKVVLVSAAGEKVLFTSADAPATFTEAQVLWIDLPKPERIETLRVHVDASRVPEWPHLDAIGLVGEALADPMAGRYGHWTKADLDRQPAAEMVWANGASASTQYDTMRFAAKFATGAPDVFPGFGDKPNTWQPKNRQDGAWLELTFPAGTTAAQLRVYETHAPGSIRQVIDLTSGEQVLYEAEGKKAPAFKEAQVLFVNLPKPRAITKIRLVVDPSRSGGWPQIDAVGLVKAP